MTRRGARLGALAAVLSLLAGCVGPVVPPTTTMPTPATAGAAPTASASPTPGRFTLQHLTWSTCGAFECTTVQVPLDHSAPDGPTIGLGVTRLRATRGPRLGSLFVNPGGPGGSGQEMVRFFDATGLEQYDIVGWDPRGVGASSPVACLDGAEADAYLSLDLSPDTPEETAALVEGARAFGQSCLTGSGADLLGHISSLDTVRDLDVMRAALGDDELHYLGVSYGTQLGALYAELFPGQVGRVVLDAPVDVNETGEVAQTVGFDRALGNFAAWCARTPSCGLGRTPASVITGLRADLDRLDAAPLAVGGRTLTQSLAAAGLAAFLYAGADAWPLLARGVRALRQGDGAPLLALADEINGRRADGTYGGLFSAFPAITCVDRPRLSVAEADRQWQRDQGQAPFFGYYLGPWYTCADWPVPATPIPPISGRGAGPILVVGATGDPATPYEWAQASAKALQSAVLVTYDGEGHGSYGGRSACVDKVVRAYLVRGSVPAAGVRCA